MRYLVPGGGTAVFLLLVTMLVFLDAPPVLAQEADTPPRGFLENVFVEGGVYTWPTILMMVAILTATAAGLLAAKRPDPWAHWPALVRGLGDAGFLFALMTTFAGMREAMHIVATAGAAVTTSDIAYGLASAFSTLIAGAAVALVGLGGAALLRARRPLPAARG